MAESEVHNSELSPDGAGARLRRAREAAGLSLADIAARTKIAERHLASIEQGRFGDLASSTYAVGFARAYARAVDLDEIELAQAVRAELSASYDARPAPKADVFEPGDPARVPGSRLAWLAGLAALAVIVIVFVFWRSYFSPAATLPELVAERPPSAEPSSGVPAPAAATGQAVVFTALEPGVWVKFYDAAGAQLMQKQMAKGESYTVPAGADGPLLRTARPDALQIAVGGRIVPRLSERSETISDVPVSAAALLARAAPPASQAAAPSPSAAAAPSPTVSRTGAEGQAQAAPTARPSAGPSPRPRATPTGRPTAAPAPGPAPSPASAASATPSAAPVETSTVSN